MDKESFQEYVRNNKYEINDEFIIIDLNVENEIYVKWRDKWETLIELGYTNEEIFKEILLRHEDYIE